MYKFKVSQLAIATIFSLPTVLMFATPKALAQNYYGAIAYSQSADSHGYSYDYYSQGEAEARALQECNSYSGGSYDCVVTIWFRNACGALATTPDGAYGSAWGVNETVAERNALETCSQYGQGCSVTRWVCTSR